MNQILVWQITRNSWKPIRIGMPKTSKTMFLPRRDWHYPGSASFKIYPNIVLIKLIPWPNDADCFINKAKHTTIIASLRTISGTICWWAPFLATWFSEPLRDPLLDLWRAVTVLGTICGPKWSQDAPDTNVQWFGTESLRIWGRCCIKLWIDSLVF